MNCAGSQWRLYLRMLDQGVVGGNPTAGGAGPPLVAHGVPLFPTTAPGACFCLAHLTFSDELSTLKMRFYTNPHISALARKPHRRPPLGSKRGGDGTQAPRVQGTPQPRFVPALLFPVFWVVSFRCKIPILSLQGFPDAVAREGPFAGSNPRAHCLNPPRELGSRGPTALLLGG